MANYTMFRSLLATLLLALFSCAATANSPLIPSPPGISAGSYILMDPYSGEVLIEGNSHERLSPASLTKMMTAYIVERELDEGRIAMSDSVPISVNAWRTGGSRTFVQEGTQASVEDLLRGVIIQSGNDASVALAEFVAGSEDAFADIMNQQARQLGMEDTQFVNSTGLPSSEQYSSAYDLALLAKAIITDYPQNYPLYAERQFTYNNIRQPNRNTLLWRDPSVDGLKTGHTQEAGYCLVASAEREGTRFIAVVMGTDSPAHRAQEVQKMLNYGFRYFDGERLFERGQKLVDSRVWGGAGNEVRIGMDEDVFVTIPRGSKSSLSSEVEVDNVIKAPVRAGDELGRVRVTLEDEVIVDRPIYALENVEEGGLFKRLWDAIKLFFIQLF